MPSIAEDSYRIKSRDPGAAAHRSVQFYAHEGPAEACDTLQMMKS